MSIREFAASFGISERMVSRWEAAGEKIHPRPVNQASLDDYLAKLPSDVQARFADLIGESAMIVSAENASQESTSSDVPGAVGQDHQIRHPIDGKLMTLVDAGVFLHGTDDEPVFLPAFYIDVFPTTNADYARFIAATGHKPPQHWNKDGEPPEDLLNHPVVFVTWHDASSYAAWSAKILPSSQQWEKAARGIRGEIYPWGSQITPAKCNVREGGIRATTPVDRYHSGVSPYGIYDMCGNTWEWLSTESELGRYELKGSAFTSPFSRAAPSMFNDASASMLDDDTGFRCVTPCETMQALINMNS